MIDDLSDAVALLGSGNYLVTRRPASFLFKGRKLEPQTADEWAPGIVYSAGDRVSNDNQVYEAKTGGLSGASPGPIGAGDDVPDGACVWSWQGPVLELEEFSIDASVQPVSQEQLQRLPEGMRTQEVQNLFTSTELNAKTEDSEPDTIFIDGSDWEVQAVESWASLGGYYRAVVARVGR